MNEVQIILNPVPSKVNDLTKSKFGRWTVIGFSRIENGKRYLWWCECECGEAREVWSGNLKNGTSKSCGCLHKEIAAKSSFRHGGIHDYTYTSWRAMIERCSNPNHVGHKTYHDQGVSVCERWKQYDKFLHDIGPRPNRKTVDRWPDNKGNYSCGSCGECLSKGWKMNARWATPKQQGENKSNALLVEFNGAEISVQDLAIQSKVKYSTLRYRLRVGWPIKDAVIPISNLERGDS